MNSNSPKLEDLLERITQLEEENKKLQGLLEENMIIGEQPERKLSFISLLETLSNIAVQGYTAEGTVTYWNKASENLYGYTANEAIGKNLLDLIIPLKMRSTISENIAQMILSGEKMQSEELLLNRKDGSLVVVFSNHMVISQPDKEPELFCISIDLTQRNKAEEIVAENESKYRTIFEANRDGIALFFINPDETAGLFFEVNSAAAEMLGYSKEEFIQFTPRDLEVLSDSLVLSERQQQIKSKGFVAFETKLRHKTGNLVKVEIMSTLIQYQGRIAVMNITRDLTERKKTEAMLRILSNATEQSPASIVITDAKGNIEYVNPKFTRLTGYQMEDALGQNPRILNSGFTPPEVFSSMWSTITSGKEWSGEFQNKKRSGELYYESAIISPILDDEGNIAHFVAVKEDITDRKLTDEALIQSERILREAQEVARVGYYIFNVKANTWESSHVLDEIFGIDSSYERSSENWIKLIAPEHQEMMINHLDSCLKEYGRFNKDYKIVRISDGEERWVSGLGEVEYDDKGNPIKMMGTIQDITERMQKEQEIIKAKERAEESEKRLKQSEIQLKLRLDNILSPEVEMPELKLTDIVDLELLQKIQDSFAKATGVASLIIDPAGVPITEPTNYSGVCNLIRSTSKGFERCKISDAKIGSIASKTKSIHIEQCSSCGFVDASTPMLIGNRLVALWTIGQASLGEVDEERLASYAQEIGADPQKMIEEYRKMSNMPLEKFKAVTNLLSYFATELSSLAYHNLLLARKVEEQQEYEAELIRAKELAEENERQMKEKNEEFWTLNEELTEANTQLEEFNEVIQQKAADIKQREAIMNSTINNIPFDFWARDLNGVCFLQNDISKSYWGSMLGNTPDMQGVSEDTLAKWLTTNKRIYDGETLNEEMEYFDKFGVKRNLNAITAPIIENDQVLGILGINIDISERKQFEQEIIMAKEKAEESDKLKSTFLATMSHELRTPLNAIIGFSQILPSIKEIEKISGFSQIINQQGKHLLGIIESMFELSLLDAGEVKIKVEPFEIAGLFESIEQAASQSQKRWNRSQLKVLFAPSKSTKGLMVFSDLSKLKQVLINIVDNAIKFTLQGSVEYGYSISGNDLTLFVKDTGKGIDPANFNLIFAPFRQVDDSFSREFDGVGLGLAICKKTVTLLNGEIIVQSELGKGSTFSIVLHNAVTNKSKSELEKLESALVSIDLTGITILIAEDDAATRSAMEQLIKDVNGKVVLVSNGKDAVDQAIKNEQISLVLMNIKMPIMNGIEAMQHIKNVKPALPIIALTAFAMPGDQPKLLYYGFDDYLSKPINSNVLYTKIAEYRVVGKNSTIS